MFSSQTNKGKLTSICELLEINQDILECPQDGFTATNVNEKTNRAFVLAQRIVLAITKGVCELVSPSNPVFTNVIMSKKMIMDVPMERLTRNISDLILFGESKIRIITQSILDRSFDRKFVNEVLSRGHERYSGQPNYDILKGKSCMGKVQFATIRKIFEVMKQGRDVPKNNYTYRIDSNKLSTAVVFLQQSLLVKPGVLRDVTISGNIFKNIPIYERGGKSVESLYEAYKKSFPKKDVIGRDTFTDLGKLLTKRGESKAGLSTYYIQLRYSGKILVEMMKRITCFPYSNSSN